MIRPKTLPTRSLKGLRIVPPPDDVCLEELARRCRYVGSNYHRTVPGGVGSPRSKARGTKCPEHLQREPQQVQSMLQEAIQKGHCGKFEGGFPRRAWRRVNGTIFEARQGSPGSGEYHGYPLDPKQEKEFLRHNAGF